MDWRVTGAVPEGEYTRPARRRRREARGRGRDARRHELDGARLPRGGRAARGRGHLGRGRRPAHARRRSTADALVALGGEDRPRDRRRRGPPQLRRHRRARRGDRGERAFYHLDAPVRRLGAMDVPVPFSPPLEDETVPTAGARRRGRARALPARLRRESDGHPDLRRDGSRLGGARRTSSGSARERLARAKAGLERSELGALLCFDMSNIRYITATHIGMWAVDKYVRFCLLPQGDEPIMWDFGSAARHHKIYSPWLGEERSRAGISTLRGSVEGRAEAVAEKIRVELEQRGLLDEPLGVDIVELPVLRALEAAGITVVDGQALMQDVRMIKTADEITLLNTACAMVDAAYDDLFKAMRPGMRENECVALVSKRAVRARLGARRGRERDLRRALQPASARLHRPDAASRATPRTSTSSTRTTATAPATTARSPSGSASRALVDAYKRCRDILDQAISLIRPGRDDRRGRRGLPEGAGVRLPGRGGGVRAPVRARRRAVELGEADLQPARLVRLPRDDRGGDGLRARDVLARVRRLAGGADRGAARRHAGRLRGDHALPRRGAARHRRPALDRRADSCRRSARRSRTSTTRRSPTRSSQSARGEALPVD